MVKYFCSSESRKIQIEKNRVVSYNELEEYPALCSGNLFINITMLRHMKCDIVY
jgi:hypothetical protein